MARITLAGAGPGDSELVTLKTLNRIKTADCILCDALVSDELLKYARDDAKIIFVGKRAGKHSMKQDKINELIYKAGLEYENVLRLKGGDPFVFGRGGEEYLYLKERGITPEVIPGVSSATAAPLLAAIPITHRGVAKSFTVLTGHEMKDDTINYEALAKLNGTIVILMGIGNTKKICDKLLANGKDPQTPVCFIENASVESERVTKTTLSEAAEVKEKYDIKTPGIIVIGEAVNVL